MCSSEDDLKSKLDDAGITCRVLVCQASVESGKPFCLEFRSKRVP